jgi:tetratricopeptide (TPR) repeat protein
MFNKLKNKLWTKNQSQLNPALSSELLSIQATYNYGVSLFHLGQDWAYDHAIEAFQKVLTALPSNGTSLPVEIKELAQGSLACTYAKLSSRKRQQNKLFYDLTFEQTKPLLENLNTNKIAKALAFTANGLAYMSQDKYDHAIDSFKNALEFDNNTIALLGIGEAYLKSGKREEAIDAYQKANQMATKGGYAAYRLGNLFRETNNKEMAIEAYKRASTLSVARLALGKIYLDDENLEAALEEFRNAVHINSKNSEALVNVAWTILEMQTADEHLIKECVNAAKRSVQLERGNTNEWHRRTVLALSLIVAHKPEQALREAKLGFDLSPDKAQTKFCVALCEFHLGRQDDAKHILLEILHSDERGLWRTKAERLMQEMKGMKSMD